MTGKATKENEMDDLRDLRVGRLTVLRRAEDRVVKSGGKIRRYSLWQVKCDCGEMRTVQTQHLLAGTTVSCGCKKAERGATLYKHTERSKRHAEPNL